MKNIFLVLIFLLVFIVYAKESVKIPKNNSFITHWIKEYYIEKKLYSSFNIDLNITDNNVIGNFCYVTHFGNRIDCDNKFKGNLKKQRIFFNFNSSYGAKQGRAMIIINDDNISWELLDEPLGEFYAPKKSILFKKEKLK